MLFWITNDVAAALELRFMYYNEDIAKKKPLDNELPSQSKILRIVKFSVNQ